MSKEVKINKGEEVKAAPIDSVNIGTPPAVLFPARNYKFRIVNDNVTINISRMGSYNELAPEIFNEEDGSYNIFDEGTEILYMPSITKVLFAEHKYPDLDANQLFVLLGIKLHKETVDIIGQIIEIMPK